MTTKAHVSQSHRPRSMDEGGPASSEAINIKETRPRFDADRATRSLQEVIDQTNGPIPPNTREAIEAVLTILPMARLCRDAGKKKRYCVGEIGGSLGRAELGWGEMAGPAWIHAAANLGNLN